MGHVSNVGLSSGAYRTGVARMRAVLEFFCRLYWLAESYLPIYLLSSEL